LGYFFQLEFPILTYQTALIWFSLGLLTIERNSVLGLALVVLAALTRLDYQFAVFLVMGFLVVSFLVHGGRLPRLREKEWILAGVVCSVAIFVMINLSDWNTGTSRGWSAVKQHYAIRLDREGVFPGNNSFLEYGLVTDGDFPDAYSLGSALRINAQALTSHVLWNLRHMPGSYFDLVVPAGAERIRFRLPLLAVGLVIMTGLIASCRSPKNAGSKLWALFLKSPLASIAVLSGLLAIVPGAIAFAKSAYLLPVLLLGLVLVGIFYRLGSGSEAINRAGALCAFALVLAATLSGTRPYIDRSRPRPVLATVVAIDDVLPSGQGAVFLGVLASSLTNYMGPRRVIPVEPLESAMGGNVLIEEVRLDRLIERHGPDLIMIDSNWRRSAYFDTEGAVRLPQLGWTESADSRWRFVGAAVGTVKLVILIAIVVAIVIDSLIIPISRLSNGF
jgi:hypothetical protein